MIDKGQIGIRILALRKKAGLSQNALAEKLGVSPQAVSKWESGKNLPDIDIFHELAWLFDVTIDQLVDGKLDFSQHANKIKLPANVNALVQNQERRMLLESLSPYCIDSELYNIAKELASGNMTLSLAATIEKREEKQEKTAFITPEALEKHTMQEIAPYFAKVFTEAFGAVEAGLRKVEPLMLCPICGGNLVLETVEGEEPHFTCKNHHRYNVVDGVIDFGSREIPGEMWSQFLRNYDRYKLENVSKYQNSRYQMGEISCSELRWRELKKLRPRVILDIASGTGRGLSYDLQRINWPCLVIMTDLSHRVLKYNKRYFTEEMVNPYVDVVCIACDCSNLPIKEECIDVVVSNAGFESMQDKMMAGFQEGYRILKKSGNAVYNISVVNDFNSENTKKWITLYQNTGEFANLEKMCDIKGWEAECTATGYEKTRTYEVYGEMLAPDGDMFPFENEMLQWMGEYLCVSTK